MSDGAKRLRKLEDLEAIRRLKHYNYCHCVDRAVAGDTATGLWYVNCPVVFTEASPVGRVAPGLIAGRYEEEYVREDGVWKWRRIVALLDVVGPADEFWANASMLRSNR